MPKFGNHVRALRKARGLTQEALEARSGVSQAGISKAERAETYETAGKLETLLLLAKALEVSLVELGVPADAVARFGLADAGPGDAHPPGPSGPPAPRLRVVMDADSAGDVAALEAALLALTAAGGYDLADFDAARTVVRETFRHLDPGAVTQHAEALLRAAKGLRKEGKAATVTDILARMAYGPSKGAYEAGSAERDRVNAEADAGLRAMGFEPGQGAAALQERLAQQAAKKRRREED